MEQRSTLVTVVGWIFIVLSGLALLECLTFLFSPMDKMFAQLPAQPGQPALDPAMMASFMRGMMTVVFLIFSWVFISSIGLVRRKNWARISYMVMMILGIGWNALYLLGGLLFLAVGAKLPTQNGGPDMAVFSHVIGIFMIVFGLAFVSLFGWILYMLNTERIRKEFQPAPPAS